MNKKKASFKNILASGVTVLTIAAGTLFTANAQAAVIYVNPHPSCTYYPQYNYIRCYYPNHTSKVYYSTKTYHHCNYHGICYTVRCFDYPFYHQCYKYTPNRVY